MTLIIHAGYGYSKKLCEAVTSWYLNRFHYYDEIEELLIQHRSLKNEGATGFCYCIDKNNYEIELDVKMNKETYVKSLLHELVHLSDWYHEHLQIKNGKLYYYGKLVGDSEPHETHATLKEEQLYSSFTSVTENSPLLIQMH